MKLYLYYLKMHLKSKMQYKISFILSFVSQIFVFFTYYFIIIALFEKFDNIKGFTIYEVLLTFAVIQFGFAINETFARGIDHFDKLIVKGEYDRILIRPRNLLLQVLGYEIDYTKICKVLQAIVVLVIAIINIDVVWNINKVITLILMLISAILIFFGIFLIARITSYNVCYTKLLRKINSLANQQDASIKIDEITKLSGQLSTVAQSVNTNLHSRQM